MAKTEKPPSLFAEDPAILEQHLAEAEQGVAVAQRNLIEQRARVAEVEREGHDSEQSRNLLANIENSYALAVAERDRLRHELAAARP